MTWVDGGAHVFMRNGTLSHVVIGVGCVPGIAGLCLAFGLFEHGLVLFGIASFAAAIATFAAAGTVARRVGIRVEVDDEGIRERRDGSVRAVRWADARSVGVEREAAAAGGAISILRARVDDGAGTRIEVSITTLGGKPIDPAASGALAILEREAAVPLAAREVARAAGGRPVRPVGGTYASFPRTGWVALGFAALMVVAGLKLALVDRFYLPLGYTGTFALACAAYAVLCWAWVGELELGERELRGGRRVGESWSIPRHAIARVEPYGSDKHDSRGVRVVLTDGTHRTLARLQPPTLRDQLLALP